MRVRIAVGALPAGGPPKLQGLLDLGASIRYKSAVRLFPPAETLNPKGTIALRVRENRGSFESAFAASLCFLIFLFVLQATLDRYARHSHSQVHLSKFSKVRIEVNEVKALVAPVVICVFAAALTYALLFGGEPLVERVFGSLIAHDLCLSYQSRFLRPPPIHS